MVEISFVSPLKAPSGVQITPKSQKRYDSGFSPSLSLEESLRFFEEEYKQLPSNAHVTLYSNYDNIAVPSARKRVADDSSICCEIKLNNKTSYLVSHQWGLTEHNIYTIHLTLRTIHNMVRWGVCDYERLLAAFSSNTGTADAVHFPSQSEQELVSRGQWLAILRLDENATLNDANEAYRFYAKKAAPNGESLLRLNQAISCAREYFSKRGG